jgi:hypothetical protein
MSSAVYHQEETHAHTNRDDKKKGERRTMNRTDHVVENLTLLPFFLVFLKRKKEKEVRTKSSKAKRR